MIILLWPLSELKAFQPGRPVAIFDYSSRFQPILGKKGMVASQEKLASRVGLDMIRQGGNAIDAAVAVGFVLAVTLPKAGNLGGGGFMLVHLASQGKTVALDFRETAPAAATRDMYLDEKGGVDRRKARYSYLSVGVPGTPAGLIYALEHYGTMPLSKVMEPAIALASKGIEISHSLYNDFNYYQKRLSVNPTTRSAYYKQDGTPYQVGETLRQPDLAWSLRQIAKQGAKAFYEGKVAHRLVAAMKRNGGLITSQDLRAYRVVEMEPVRGSYRGYQVVSMPPPSSGGVHIIQMLNILEAWPLGEYGANSARTLHLMAESMRLAYADRSEYLGDPAYTKVPVKALTSKTYAAALRKGIDPEKARPSIEVKPGNIVPYESPDTTHYTVMDGAGNAVSVTYTLNFSFGTGIVAEGTGILLNNEMDDFSAKPGSPNAYGLLGGEANAIQAGKRPLSSMTPTIIFKDNKPYLVTGSPGGSRIITTILQLICNVIDHKMNVAVASSMARIHHQWNPDMLYVEQGISLDTQALLTARGHVLKQGYAQGSTQSILYLHGKMFGASDPRRPGAITVSF